MVWSVKITGANRPHSAPHEYGNENEEEDAAHFEPEDAADPAEGTQESGNSARNASAGAARGSPAVSQIRWKTGGARAIWLRGWLLHGCSDALAGNASCDAQPDAQYPADGLRSHFDMMVSATVGALLVTAMYTGSCPYALVEVR